MSHSDKILFIKSYVNTLNDGFSPVVLNSSIPKDVINNLFNKVTDKYTGQKMPLGHILCSSGTTSQSGVPKSFYFNIEQSLANAKAHYDSLSIIEPLNILFPLPLTHSFGVVVGLLGSFTTSAHSYIYESTPSPTSIIKDIDKYNIDLLYLTPTLARMIIKFKKFIKLKGDGPRKISIGSSPLYANEILELMSIFKKADIYFTYGLTEAGPRVTTLHCGSFEKPSPIIKKSNTLPLGEPLLGVELKYEDNLKIRSIYAHCSEYFDSEDMIIKSLDTIYLKGRADFVIITGGVNIYPNELEALVDNINGVKRSCLVGVESKLYGEIPVLAFVKSDKTDTDTQDLKKIINDTLIKNLPTSHIPHDIIELNNIETTSLGKVMRARVVNMIKDYNDRKTT